MEPKDLCYEKNRRIPAACFKSFPFGLHPAETVRRLFAALVFRPYGDRQRYAAKPRSIGPCVGFVKYHHPAFSDDRYDLDFELFELLPLVADTAPAARNEILAQWIDGFGRYKTASEKYEKILASDSVFEHRTDIGWIRDTATLGRELSERLVRLRSADRTAGNRYVSQTYYETYDQWSPNPCFDGENPITTCRIPTTAIACSRYSVSGTWSNISFQVNT